MRLRVVPIEFACATPDVIAVAQNEPWAYMKGDILDDAQANPGGKMNFTFDGDNGGAPANRHQGGEQN